MAKTDIKKPMFIIIILYKEFKIWKNYLLPQWELDEWNDTILKSAQ